MHIHYFAYGSNIASHRLLQRVPNASIYGAAILRQHQLSFRKNDSGQSGKCDIVVTDNTIDQVYGVVYLLNERDKQVLDIFEGHGTGYLDKAIEVIGINGEALQAITYYAIDIDDRQLPYHWYKEHVLRGAREHGFPDHYIAQIEAHHSIDDSDQNRVTRELAIYR